MTAKMKMQLIAVGIVILVVFLQDYIPAGVWTTISIIVADLLFAAVVAQRQYFYKPPVSTEPSLEQKTDQTKQFTQVADKYRTPILFATLLLVAFFAYSNFPLILHVLTLAVVDGYLEIARMVGEA